VSLPGPETRWEKGGALPHRLPAISTSLPAGFVIFPGTKSGAGELVLPMPPSAHPSLQLSPGQPGPQPCAQPWPSPDLASGQAPAAGHGQFGTGQPTRNYTSHSYSPLPGSTPSPAPPTAGKTAPTLVKVATFAPELTITLTPVTLGVVTGYCRQVTSRHKTA